ncbi:hypothetical protein GFY24_08730 [Nocardia sp. SYP-A9097]|uniref:hypothetical protein n=1 Tax=Nocardia sp. SYP-A9097 TaxID=2663237 RepID=UPI00129AD642|nr:hypothetical protein [Nocardia sp. SYP-A9097]MRH87539.1 hypothetical protein [Nocardia sp. SYP-A9097]
MKRIATTVPTIGVTLVAILALVGCSTDTSTHPASITAQTTTSSYPDTLYKDADMIAIYNETHPGTFDRINNYADKNGRSFQFFDSNGHPNADVIQSHRDVYTQARDTIVPIDFQTEYYSEHGYN